MIGGSAQEHAPDVVLPLLELPLDLRAALGRHGLAEEVHARLLRREPALAVVAPVAGGDDVRPAVLPAARARDHVVERELANRAAVAAVLAAELVAGEDVA